MKHITNWKFGYWVGVILKNTYWLTKHAKCNKASNKFLDKILSC